MQEERVTSPTGAQKNNRLVRPDLIPVRPYLALAELFGIGARKYSENNWRGGMDLKYLYAAMIRHANAFWMGQDFDVCSNDPGGCSMVDRDGNPFEPHKPDTCFNHTGAHHLTQISWNSFAMLDIWERCPEYDNRFITDK